MDFDPTMAPSLDALVAGKRSAPRKAVDLPARVKGLRGEYAARVLDISRDGALVSIPLAELGRPEQAPLGPAEQFALLEEHFRDSFDLLMPDHGVVVEAQVVRMLVTTEDSGDLALGVCFVEPLGESQQEKLHILEAGDSVLPPWGEATLAHPLTHAADPARPVAAFLHADGAGEHGPLHLAPVIALGRSVLVVRLDGLDCSEVLASLGVEPGISLRHGTRTLHESPVRPVAVRYVDTPRPGTEVLLEAEAKLPRALRKHFRRA